MSRLRSGSYSLEEVEALIEGYAELVHLKHKPAILVRLADLERAVKALAQKPREAVLLYGILGFSNEAAGRFLGISEAAVRKRYRHGLDYILTNLNGDDEWL